MQRTPWLQAGSWITYDVANTVYASTLTYILTVHVQQVYGQTTFYGLTQTIAMIASGLLIPFLAATVDRTGKARSYLVISSGLCIGAMMTWGMSLPLWGFLLFFGLAHFSYNSALVFYNSLLPSVAPQKSTGLVSGLGIGLGYLGTFLTLIFLLPVVSAYGSNEAFLAAGLLFLVLALPCFFFVKERRIVSPQKNSWKLFKTEFYGIKTTLKEIRQNKKALYFLIVNFFCVDVLNTAILYFALYTQDVFSGQKLHLFGLSYDLRFYIDPDGDKTFLLPGLTGFLTLVGIVLTSLAMIFGIIAGRLSDLWGALKVFVLAVVCLFFALMGGIVFTGNTFSWEENQEMKELAAKQASPADWKSFAESTKNNFEMLALDNEVVQAQRAKANKKGIQSSNKVLKKEVVEPKFRIGRSGPSAFILAAYILSFAGLGAFGLAGIWTAGRKYLLEIVPQEKAATYFGIYGITMKLSVVGTTIFALLFDLFGSFWAIVSQLAPLLLSLLLLVKVFKYQPKDNKNL